MPMFKNFSGRFLILATAIIALDFISKIVVIKTFQPYEHIEWLGGLIGIGRISTVKMSFGFRFGYASIDIVQIILDLILVIGFFKIQRIEISKLYKYAATLIVFGLLGNYLDRAILANGNIGYLNLSYLNLNNSFTNLSSLMHTIGWTLLLIALISKFSDFKLIFRKQKVPFTQ
jgi:lipoprotein signal peptidase